jgi:RimJ/RimL family protein N-acetyltransferase
LGRRDRRWYARLYTDALTMTWIAAPLTPEQARRSAETAITGAAGMRYWVIESGRDRQRAGLVGWQERGSELELGVILLPAWQRRGLAGASLQALCAHARHRHGVPRVTLRHAKGHHAMAAVARRLGFQLDPARTGDGNRRWHLDLGAVPAQTTA